ncbi:geranylgeranylglyceryl phosphate synthase-like protein [bacterium BMS3Abin05]|nr:geranylgeranylglyceryl phosphate synthase-like protein [bacterium BMS3Abin05]GBE28531.1 geranylgeranylglyceryl phosphate synthase-like protein [bacterium BMS3Bbin03]HDK35668.1 geranylgeranylglyceryl/heptaprenylglyceryl phosphate synthase [Bacteroidota bacterium]HDZ10958.1 geranylgeranylglyceryl/heptaprenylglyceryl phosphate synthase [Bacteroidota bacterium]
MNTTYKRLLKILKKSGSGYFVLFDPDNYSQKKIGKHVALAAENGVDAFLVGGSLLFYTHFSEFIKTVKKHTDLPVIIFPGSSRQISPYADAILFLSLISGRNSDYLIGEHVIAAPIIRSLKLEPISTGYLLVESGNATTVEYLSGTRPIPRNKPEIAIAHALAAEYLGMKMLYFEAGSGAEHSVPAEMIQAVSKETTLPLIVGGGIRTPEEAHKKVESGASFIVTGNILEKKKDSQIIRAFADAIHRS